MKNNLNTTRLGLHQDNIPENQPPQTVRFALNTIKESQLGDTQAKSPERANEVYTSLKEGYVPIGKVYISDNRLAIFSVTQDNSISEIGILHDNNSYEEIVNDETSSEENKLGFKVENQIDATYRLRGGCNDTLYFTDNLNPPRYFNLSKPEDFKDSDTGEWVSRTFDLIKSYNSIPTIDDVQILNNQGSLLPGSYSVLIQYLDDDFNATSFLTEVPGINIYHDNLQDTYADIGGSINLEEEAYAYGSSNKAIQVTYGNFDTSYNYYRLAFLGYTDGSGTASSVDYTAPLSTNTKTFIYTGTNGETAGSLDDIVLSDNNPVILKAKNIEQIENRLILSNTVGQEIEFCKLQRYASKIKADCVVKETILTNIEDPNNTKNPLVKYNGLSYQPGEVYSFGIVYVFSDMSYSPVYHIPGKSPLASKNERYTEGDNVHPMDNTNNNNNSEFYTDNSSCNNNSLWGLDSEGNALLEEPVRHHRFPTRNSIGVPFVQKIEQEVVEKSLFSKLRLTLSGNVEESYTCEEGELDGNGDPCEDYVASEFRITINYKLDGVEKTFFVEIEPDVSVPTYIDSDIFLATKEVTDIEVYHTDEDTNTTQIVLTDGTSEVQDNNLTYTVKTVDSSENTNTDAYTAPIFGIKFSGVELPTKEVTGSLECIGYYIVRQERKDYDRTILDSGIVVPTLKNGTFVSAGLLAPEFDDDCEETTYDENHCYRTSSQNIQLISPLHKFTDTTFDNFTSLEEQGKFSIVDTTKTGTSYQDILEGSSSDGVDTNRATSDSDGYSLRQIIRSTKVEYGESGPEVFSMDNSNTKIYNLNGASYAKHDNAEDTIYNLAIGNKALIFSKNDDNTDLRTYRPYKKEYPYVYVKNDKQSFYSNFRSNEYYMENENFFTDPECELYKGDIYIAPLRYDNHVFCNAVAGTRRESLSFWSAFLAVITVVVGVVLAIWSGGTSLILVGGVLTALAGVAMGAASVIEVADFNDIYSDKWQKGLDKTVFDIFYHKYMWRTNINNFNAYQWRDDTFKWYGDILGDLWFETPINISLRVEPTNNSSNFLKPLQSFMDDREDNLDALDNTGENDSKWDFQDDYTYYKDVEVLAEGVEEVYFHDKITVIDSDKTSGYEYIGASIPKVYLLNTDHNVLTKVRRFYHLALEYDCCSDCNETFPHRWYWSEQSFQEELTDNYRTFLANNYKDISGETGEIINSFSLMNNLYFHTKEALWLQPRQNQERVTDQIVSFIGTGEFGSVPGRQIVHDDSGNSAGTQHKWSCIKTLHGYFFISENQGKVYKFDGQNLTAISNIGLNRWFKDNVPVLASSQYKNSSGEDYIYDDNPSNIFGTGFISVYDSNEERLLVTKKDFSFIEDLITSEDFEICSSGETLTVFKDISTTISTQETLGWTYEGIEDCKLKFTRDVLTPQVEDRYETITNAIPSTADIIIYYDVSGSFTESVRDDIRANTIDTWEAQFRVDNPDWQGNVIHQEDNTFTGERWLRSLEDIIISNYSAYTDAQLGELELVVVAFTNEASYIPEASGYHSNNITFSGQPTAGYIEDLSSFSAIFNKLKSFNGLLYPVLFEGTDGVYTALLLQQLGALKGRNYTQAEFDAIPRNSIITNDTVWESIESELINNVPYTTALEDYNWKGVWDKNDEGDEIVNPDEFASEINSFLEGLIESVEVTTEVTVDNLSTEVLYVEGEQLEEVTDLNNGWTISYALKENDWISWHSFLPNFYASVPEKVYSWQYGNENIWKHNVEGKYCTYYGVHYPHIIEYVSVSNPNEVRLWNHIELATNTLVYDEDTGEYYEDKNTTFNKMVLYNHRQCSGELVLNVKEEQDLQHWFNVQTDNTNDNEILIDNVEGSWYVNDLRDIRTVHNKPIWSKKLEDRGNNYYIDKVLNESTLDKAKTWYDLESFRGKHLVIRLIFDRFADRKLITNFTLENEQQSHF